MAEKKPRRTFLKGVAGGAAAFALGAGTAPAGQEPDRTDPKDEAEALLEVVRRRYGRFLNKEQLDTVRRKLHQQVLLGRIFQESPLANGDEPDFVFQAGE